MRVGCLGAKRRTRHVSMRRVLKRAASLAQEGLHALWKPPVPGEAAVPRSIRGSPKGRRSWKSLLEQ